MAARQELSRQELYRHRTGDPALSVSMPFPLLAVWGVGAVARLVTDERAVRVARRGPRGRQGQAQCFSTLAASWRNSSAAWRTFRPGLG
jgi:hypothetical protein